MPRCITARRCEEQRIARQSSRSGCALIALSLMLLPLIAPVALNGANAQSSWPWPQQEPYPWLDYLANLTKDRDIVLTVITRHETTILNLAREKFLQSDVAKKLGIKDVVFVQQAPGLWVDYINRRAERGTPVDVAWGGGPTLFNTLYVNGLIQPLDPNENPAYLAVLYEMSKIPDRIAGAPTKLTGPDGKVYWVGAAISSFGFTVNNDKLREFALPKPTRWTDLASPHFAKYLPSKPLVSIADPRFSTSNLRIYEIILQAHGWDEGWRILTLLAANSDIRTSSSDVRDAAIVGDVAVAITIDFYGYTAMAQNPSCEYVLPEDGTIVNADPVAVLKGTQYPVHAAAFVAWVLSEFGGQQIWMNRDVNRLPINPKAFDVGLGLERPDLRTAFERAVSGPSIEFDEDLALSVEQTIMYYFAATLVTPQTHLVNAWAAIAQAYLSGRISKEVYDYFVKKLTDPINFSDPLTGSTTTLTLEYAKRVNNLVTKPEFGSTIDEWTRRAIEKYQSVYQELMDYLAGKITLPITTINTTQTPSQTAGTQGATTSPTSQPAQQPTAPVTTIVAAVLIIVAVAVLIMAVRRR